MTDAERKLWTSLRALKRGFRRQVPIDRYIVDFVSHQDRLVIEVDGSQHSEAETYDAARTVFLESRGYRVLRFPNGYVFENVDGVIEAILPHLSPSASALAADGSR